jgi:hypothetical protein
LSERAERRYNDNDNDNEGSGNIGGTYSRTTSIYIKEIIRERERERERRGRDRTDRIVKERSNQANAK